MNKARRLTNNFGELRIEYPSGYCTTLKGQLYQNIDEGLQFTPSVVPKSSTDPISVLDPRCIITESATGKVVFHPRRQRADMQAEWVKDWLIDHPEWARLTGRPEGMTTWFISDAYIDYQLLLSRVPANAQDDELIAALRWRGPRREGHHPRVAGVASRQAALADVPRSRR